MWKSKLQTNKKWEMSLRKFDVFCTTVKFFSFAQIADGY